ncbi:MAG: ferrous iron transport protein B [Rhodothermales bacterium]|jgi:ferrous iron transport protein B
MPDQRAAAPQSGAESCVIAVMGNPNTGKTTLFNALTGMTQKVGNFPGCTVEKKIGRIRLPDAEVTAIDLPGTYSLAALSPDEMVAADVLMGNMPGIVTVDAVLVVMDASNLHRNLYVLSQVMEFGLPVIAVLNMMDIAERRKLDIDVELLTARLGIPVIPIQATARSGLEALKTAIHPRAIRALPAPIHDLLPEYHKAAADLAVELQPKAPEGRELGNSELFRALVDNYGHSESRLGQILGPELQPRLEAVRAELEGAPDLAGHETGCRYQWISATLDGVMIEPEVDAASFSDKVDQLLTHRVWGVLIFMALMYVVFQSIYSWAGPLINGVDTLFSGFGGWLGSKLAPGMLHSLVVDGIIGGVGAVIVFIPQIAILFLFIAVLEGCGYLSRGAYLMDKLLANFGLSGKSFIPLMSSFACAIPGIMAARTIENSRDRLATILIAPLMSCSARLPVYVVLIGAFIPSRRVLGILNLQGLTLFALYSVGVFAAIGVALILKRTSLKGEPPPFLMELPSYKVPEWRTVGHCVYSQSKAFLLNAGTIIFALTVVIWALGYFPRPASIAAEYDVQRAAADVAWVTAAGIPGAETAEQVEAALAADEALAEAPAIVSAREAYESAITAANSSESGAYLRQSVLGRMGHGIEPLVKPLGWDWKIGMAVIASFPAREVIIATLGTIYNLGGELDEGSTALRDHLKSAEWPDGRPVYNVPVALSIMIFFALCAQCMATLAVIRRETNSWRWPILTFVYMTALAYGGAFITFHLTTALGWGA